MQERGRPADEITQRRFRIGDLVVDPGQAAITRDGGTRLPVAGLSYDLLLVLARAAPDLVTHDELMQRVWKGVVVSPETIGQRVKLLRDALGDDPRTPKYVTVVRGRGYRLLTVPVAAEATGPTPDDSGAESTHALPLPTTTTSTSSVAEAMPLPAAEDVARQSRTAGTPAATRRRPFAYAVLVLAGAAALAAVVATRPTWLGRSTADGPGGAESATAPASVEVVGAPPRSVAVLPFRNLSPDPANRFIGHGLAEIVLNRLASTPSLFVVARSSSFAFEDRGLDAREIARQLGVRHLVQGGVQRDGERLRITAQLIDAASGRPLKVLTYDRALEDLFALQDEIATQLAGALDVSLQSATEGPANLAAELEYLQGLAALGRWRVAEAEAALRHFRSARELDPGFARAYAGEAKAHMRIAFLLGGRFEDAAPQARPLVERALALDPKLATAYVARASLAEDARAREVDLRRAIELAPNDAEGWFELGQLLDGEAPVETVLEHLERAIALDPLQPRYRYVHAIVAQSHDRDPALYEQRLREVLRLDPNYAQALSRLAQVVTVYRGDFAEAILLAERALAADPRAGAPRAYAADFYLAIGDVAAAEEVMRGHAVGAQYAVAFAFARGDALAAENLARRVVTDAGAGRGPPPATQSVVSFVAYTTALSNAARRNGDYATMSRALTRYFCNPPDRASGCVSFNSLSTALVLAELEVAAGRRANGESAARRLMELFDANPDFTFPIRDVCRSRVRLLFGDTAGALTALEDATRNGRVVAWWLLLEHDRGYDAVREHPRFRALLEATRRNAAEQRVLLERMRAEGRVPRRSTARVG